MKPSKSLYVVRWKNRDGALVEWTILATHTGAAWVWAIEHGADWRDPENIKIHPYGA